MNDTFSEGFRSIDDGFTESKKLFAWPQAHKNDVAEAPSVKTEEKKESVPEGITIAYLFAHWKPFYDFMGMK